MIEQRSVGVDDGRWVQDAAVYRVYFWTQLSSPEPPARPMWSCEPLQLTGAADAREVLEWAEANAAGRSFTVYVEVDVGPISGLVVLAGVDPTRAE